MSYADANGLRLYCETAGSGPPLVLLHGGGGSGGMFDTVRPALGEGRMVVAQRAWPGPAGMIPHTIPPLVWAGTDSAAVKPDRTRADVRAHAASCAGPAAACHDRRMDSNRPVLAVPSGQWP